jgi:hypothetical protein
MCIHEKGRSEGYRALWVRLVCREEKECVKCVTNVRYVCGTQCHARPGPAPNIAQRAADRVAWGAYSVSHGIMYEALPPPCSGLVRWRSHAQHRLGGQAADACNVALWAGAEDVPENA